MEYANINKSEREEEPVMESDDEKLVVNRSKTGQIWFLVQVDDRVVYSFMLHGHVE